MSFTPVTVTRRYLRNGPGGLTSASGRLVFTPTAQMTNTGTLIAAPVTAQLGNDGDLLVVLAATNDPDTAPTGVTYEVSELLDGQPERRYRVGVPYDAPDGTVDLTTLI